MSGLFRYSSLVMTNNVVLRYLDLIFCTRDTSIYSFFKQKKSFHAEVPVDPSLDLPIQAILLGIHDAADLGNAKFFEPFILHYWQLVRLLDSVRCNTPLLQQHAAFQATIKTNSVQIKALHAMLRREARGFQRGQIQRKIYKLIEANRNIQIKIAQDQTAMRDNPQFKENIQTVLVLTTLLNVIFRHGMSAPLLSDQLRLQAQKNECREWLYHSYNISFDSRFLGVFAQNPFIQTHSTVAKRLWDELEYDLSSAVGGSAFRALRPVDHAIHYASRVQGTQDYHIFYNHFRLGATRARRLFVFIEPYWQNESYTAVFKTIDPYVRATLGFVNWMFFIPRLSLNFSLLYHHLFNTEKLSLLERKLDWKIRLRAHWTRFWFEIISDCYWVLAGLKMCFWLSGGAFSPEGILLSLIVQFLDLFCSIIRASIELYRLYKMSSDLESLDCDISLKKDLDQRFWFETFALGYTVCHFGVLMISLCLTLPSMASVSLALPVIGAVCAMMMTVITYHMNGYFQHRRQTVFEPKPELTQSDTLTRFASHAVI